MNNLSEAEKAIIAKKIEKFVETHDPDATINVLRVNERSARQVFMKNVFEKVSIYVDELLDEVKLNGSTEKGAEYIRQAYIFNMHNFATMMIYYPLRHMENRFTKGFLVAAAKASSIEPNELPLLKPNVYKVEIPEQTSQKTISKYTPLFNIVWLEWKTSAEEHMTASEHPDLMVIVPGYADARKTTGSKSRDLEVDFIRLPNEPLNDVDMIEDILVGLKHANLDHAMKCEAHTFISDRIALKEIHIWRKNYFRLEL